MDLITLLKEHNTRVSMDDKWLVWFGEEWVVMWHKYGAKRNITLYAGDSLKTAINTLCIQESS